MNTTPPDAEKPTRNVELLQRVMDHIDAHPEQHAQDVWVDKRNECGTAACFAGWAAVLRFGPDVINADGAGFALPPPYDRDEKSGSPLSMSLAAGKLLGLTLPEHCTLFDAGNTRDMLRLMVADLIAGRELGDPVDYEMNL